MKQKWIEYQVDGTRFRGYFVQPEEGGAKRPTILVAHAWRGQDAFARKKTEFLAELGFNGFALDLYGDGQSVDNNEDASALMLPLFIDREKLRKRIVAGYEAALNQEATDPEKMGAIGFCFGGLAVLELLRSGAFLQGAVSFHGVLGDFLGDVKAKTEPAAKTIHGSFLILHGYHDPLLSQEEIHKLQSELNRTNVDWQMHIYGNAYHAFTNPEAHEVESGLIYEPKSEKRALLSMKNFFEELFNLS